MKGLLKNAASNPRARQAASLYISLLLSLILGIAVSVINTRFLTPQEFGDFKLIQTVWSVGVLFVTFGLLTTGGNLLTKSQSQEEEKSLLGNLVVITALISLLFMLFMLVASIPLAELYGNEFGKNIRIYAWLLFVFPFQLFLQEALRGSNNIHSLAFLNAMPQFLYIPMAMATNHYLCFNIEWAILLYLSSLALTILFILYWIKPRVNKVGAGIKQICNHNGALGGHIYIATLVTTATTYLSQFTLGYFENTQRVGELSLAITITMPLAMIPNAIATTFFKQFANTNHIPRKILIYSVAVSVITLAGFVSFIDIVVLFLYTSKFSAAIPLTYICALACVIQGIADIYNRFLLANNKASWLKHNAIHRAAISIIGSVALVEHYGAEGAAATRLILAFVYIITMILYYKKWIADLNNIR